jgi:hypothetical protein
MNCWHLGLSHVACSALCNISRMMATAELTEVLNTAQKMMQLVSENQYDPTDGFITIYV